MNIILKLFVKFNLQFHESLRNMFFIVQFLSFTQLINSNCLYMNLVQGIKRVIASANMLRECPFILTDCKQARI